MSGQRKATSNRRRKPSRPGAETPLKRRVKKVLKWTGVTSLVLALLATLTFVVLYRAIDIPDPNADFQTETTYVYYSDGKTELGRFAEQNRSSIPLSEMPDFVKDGVVAAEDRSFWTNRGIDPRGILRAAFSNASGNDTQGASTITQQYVKILYLTQEQSYKRKIREAIVSLKLHRQQSKEQILEGYLNTIYFGRGAYGIEAAAQTWFRKPAKQLNLRESAVLSSVINNPTLFDPANGKHNKRSLKNRFTRVINAMAEMGTISASQAAKAVKRLPKFPEARAESTYGGQKGHALTLIRKELQRLGIFTDEEIQGGGLRVTTTLTKKAMDAAEQGVKEARPEGIKDLHVAAASVEPGTGALRGFYGGQDYLDSQVNWAVSGGQPGSTFKLFALAAGIDAGFALKDTFDGNSPFEFAPGQRPVRNLGGGDGTDYGRVNLIKATEDSINTAYVDLTMALPNGPKDVLKMAKAMGIPGDDKSRGLDNLHTSPGLSANTGVALGSATVSPINIANGYATVAADGVRSEAYVIEKVVDRTGKTRYTHRVSNKRVLDEDVNADVSYALQQVVKAGSGTRAQALGRPAGGKTGTATNSRDEVSSSWFVGYTPQLSTAVMMVRGTGNESLEEVLPTSYYGGTYPTLMWTAIMGKALEGTEVEALPDAAWTDGEAPSDGHAPPPPPPDPKPTRTKKPKPTKTAEPTQEPTQEPTDPPTTQEPTQEPSQEPTDLPTQEPTDQPTQVPTGPQSSLPRGLPPGTRD